jgi:hypothetical protein
VDRRSDAGRLMQGVRGNLKIPKDQAQKRQALFRSADEVQEANLFQVRKLRRESGSRDHTSGLTGSKPKVETFETYEIFQVREESESSGGGETMIVGSSAVKDLDHWNHVQTIRRMRREEIRSQRLDLSAWTNSRWI